ncbi:phosphatidylethanolamine N-methyltransferase [Phlyctochytrium bullatum]|nr:phosphatidylethanolamine N-methyltransferase [Phlyctochytrium bullatum]
MPSSSTESIVPSDNPITSTTTTTNIPSASERARTESQTPATDDAGIRNLSRRSTPRRGGDDDSEVPSTPPKAVERVASQQEKRTGLAVGKRSASVDDARPLGTGGELELDEEEVSFSWGRTFKGQVFQVPQTQDIIQSLFYPTTPQSVFEWSILTVLALELSMFMIGTSESNKMLFLYLFAFWRLAYSFGLGILLKLQSTQAFLVRWAKKWDLGATQRRKRGPWIEYFVGELKKKIGLTEEGFESLPSEFTTWILFRGLVDLITVNDTFCYIFFVLSHSELPDYDAINWKDWLRFVSGSLIIFFGWWVRLDARREIKDFAWYWGDFFFLLDTSPTLSGSFEMAPHPMYSVGYLGFYGAALIAKSYTVLFVSLAAHVGQLLFLFFVENPHLEKVYRSPNADSEDSLHDNRVLKNYFERDLIILRNFDWCRSSDLFTVGIWVYTLVTAVMVGPIEGNDWRLQFYIGQAVFWRFVYNWVLGLILHLQSTSKFWSRHFIKYGETTKEAFQQWKIIFNLSQSMTYITFFICACRLYEIPEDWSHGTVLLKHTVALVTICLHVWTAYSIHNALGDFGWFYGDFFLDTAAFRDRTRLTYTGVYRFLNHPNAWAATASAWGITWACGSWALLWLTVFGQASNWLFVRYVELPHMRRKYGTRVRPREEAGMPKALRENMRGLGRMVSGLDRRMGGRIGSLRRVMSAGGLWELAAGSLGRGEEEEEWATAVRLDGGGWRLRREPEEEDEEAKTWPRTAESSVTGSPRRAVAAEGEEEEDGSIVMGRAKLKAAAARAAVAAAAAADAEAAATEDGAAVNGEFRKRREGLPFRLSRPTSFSETMKVAVSKTKPRVDQMVEDAKMIVSKRVERLASVTQRSPSPLIPLSLYTLSFPSYDTAASPTAAPSHPIITFRLGEPIHIRFTCARETLKRLDWVGVYGASHNLSSEITTSRNSMWIFVTGLWHREDDDDPSKPLLRRVHEAPRSQSVAPVSASEDEEETGPAESGKEEDGPVRPRRNKSAPPPSGSPAAPQPPSPPAAPRILLGETPVTVSKSKNDPGLRVVTGTLRFHRTRLPWKLGAYEARYHLDGTYSVLAISQVFEVVVEPFRWDEGEEEGELARALEEPLFGGVDPVGEGGGGVVGRVVRVLREYVERCVDVDPEEEAEAAAGRVAPLSVDEDVLERCTPGPDTPDARSFSRYKERVAKRVVYGIRQIFGIDFSYKVVRILGTVRMLARKICEARVALSPVQSVTRDADRESIRSVEQGGGEDEYYDD